jgi:disulfide bond formation protein DsbB
MDTFAALAPSVVSFLSVLTLLSQVIALVAILLLLFRPTSAPIGFLGRHGLTLMLTVALVATLGSLYFSDVAGWTPCKLCWYQRIFMYPQVILLGVAVWRKDTAVARYVLLLSLIGILIAAEHYREQVMAALYPDAPIEPCDETGTSCARTPFFHFGYITIPLMALTAFTLNALGAAVLLLRRR